MTASDYSSIKISEVANETINYDTEIKAYQSDLVSSDKRTGLTGVFEGV